MDDRRRITLFHRIVLALILLAGLAGRLYRLDTVPDGFFCDEASLGYNAWAILHYGIDETGARLPLYATSLGVRKNPVFVYSSMLPIGVFGLSEWSVRLTSAVYGWLTILALFWLMFELHGTLAGLLAALFMAVLPWNFHFSRIAFELITWPCLFTAGLAAFFRGLRKDGPIWLIAGLCMGLALHSYIMAMAFLPLFLPVLVIITTGKLVKHLRWPAAGAILFCLLAIPAVMHQIQTRANFHYQAVSWWNRDAERPLAERLETLKDHMIPFYTPEFLVDIGDPNPRHTLKKHGPIYESLFYLSIAGMILSLIPPRRYVWILAAWTLFYPLGTAMTIDRYATRSIIGSPLAPIWATLAIVQVYGWLSR
nr:glycosyltransferase family 39 protein [bacterium]